MKQYAYVRVSAKDQNVDRQLDALKPYQIPEKNLFCDYQSGKDFQRPQYQKLIKKLRKGDLLIIKSIDRLGRNYEEILEQWRKITKEIQANILVLDMELLDTRNRDGNLTGALISDLVLQLLAYVAQTERDFIRQRQAEGIASAKARGVRFGKRPMGLPENFDGICVKCRKGELSIRAAAKTLHMSRSTFHRKYQEKYQTPVGKNTQEYETKSGSTCRQTGTQKEAGKVHKKSELSASFFYFTMVVSICLLYETVYHTNT